MEEILAFIYLILPLTLLAGAWAAGSWIARAHEKNMAQRQQQVAHIRTTDTRQWLEPDPTQPVCGLVTSEVTLGIDHFRGFLGRLKNIFGGEVRSYQSTLDRARREALLRLSEQAHAMGCNAIANVRVGFADISGNANMTKKASMVSILASGTAYTSCADVPPTVPTSMGS
jgi:uncharacterized protein YbjQ (UPF0145 family)